MFGIGESRRDAFLEAAREAREERAAEKNRENAAIVIQATIRGWLSRCLLRTKFCDNFDTVLGFEERGMERPFESLPLSYEAFAASVPFIKSMKTKLDRKRFQFFSRYLLASVDSDSIKFSYIGCAINKDLTVKWIAHMKEVLHLTCLQLETLHAEITSENRLISLYLHLLLTFTGTKTWQVLNQSSLEALKPALAKITENITNDLVARGMMKTLNGLKIIQSDAMLERVIDFMQVEQNLRIIFNTLEGSYSLCLLSNLVNLAHEERESTLSVIAFPKFNFVMMQLLEKCGEYVITKQSSLTQWHPVLGWFSSPLDQYLNEAMPLVRIQLQLLWSGEIVRVMFACLTTAVTQQSSDNNNQSSKTHPKTFDSPSSSSASSSLKKAFERLEEHLSSSNSGSPVSESTLKSNTGGGEGSMRKLGSPKVFATSQVCAMYYRAIGTLSQMRMDILTGLCYQSDLVLRLWQLLMCLGPQCGLKSFLEVLAVSPNVSASELYMLMLFCDTATHLISVLDDLEMYEQQKPFTLNDYANLATFLNLFVYKMIQSNSIDLHRVPSNPLFISVHTLLMLLYKRNSRRSFVPDSHWLIKDIRLPSLVADLNRGKPVALMLMLEIPHAIPHDERVMLFRRQVSCEKNSMGLGDSGHSMAHSTLITVHRNRLVEDGYRQLGALSPQALKGIIRVRFINEQGLDEAGIDQDGVFKEFLEETLKRVFDPSLNLFRVTSERRLYPSPTSAMTENHLLLFEFTGRILGKAVYEGIVVDCPFASFFLSQVIGERHSQLYSSIDELPSMDPELYRSMTYVKHYEGDINELDLTFSYDEDYLGQIKTHELRLGGRSLPVTNDNKIVYIHLMAHFKMHTQIKDQTKAFVRGFRSIINTEWLNLFSVPEFQRLISGDNVAVDLKDLRRHTQYYGGFHDKHRVICWLWDVLEKEFTAPERGLFLKFVTSCSKPPLLGFANLEPPFSVRCVEVGDDEDTGDTIGSVIRGFFAIRKRDPINRLPTSSTCFNLLKLPNYQRRSTLRDKLRYAITSNTGFELS